MLTVDQLKSIGNTMSDGLRDSYTSDPTMEAIEGSEGPSREPQQYIIARAEYP